MRLRGDALAPRRGEALRVELEDNIVASGHNAADLLEWVASGRIEMCYFSTSYLGDRVGELNVLEIPYLFPDLETAHHDLDGSLGEMLSAAIGAATGLRALWFGILGRRFDLLLNLQVYLKAGLITALAPAASSASVVSTMAPSGGVNNPGISVLRSAA